MGVHPSSGGIVMDRQDVHVIVRGRLGQIAVWDGAAAALYPLRDTYGFEGDDISGAKNQEAGQTDRAERTIAHNGFPDSRSQPIFVAKGAAGESNRYNTMPVIIPLLGGMRTEI